MYRGRVDVYNRTTVTQKLLQLDGTTDNQMLGIDVTLISTTKAFDQFSLGSNSGGAIQTR